jgi:hypothetical protein
MRRKRPSLTWPRHYERESRCETLTLTVTLNAFCSNCGSSHRGRCAFSYPPLTPFQLVAQTHRSPTGRTLPPSRHLRSRRRLRGVFFSRTLYLYPQPSATLRVTVSSELSIGPVRLVPSLHGQSTEAPRLAGSGRVLTIPLSSPLSISTPRACATTNLTTHTTLRPFASPEMEGAWLATLGGGGRVSASCHTQLPSS